MHPHETPSVAIDGHRIKRIREEKRLTQLYVAKVVGVTTDTVSRWENNRYPTIRRDNALNLAEALEVDLEEILRREEGSEVENRQNTAARTWSIIVVLVLLLIVGVWALYQNGRHSEIELHAERLQPRYAAPGSHILIRVKLDMDKPIKGVIIKEQFPEGWKLIASVPTASSIGSQGAIARWMLRNPAIHTSIAYLLEVAATADSASTSRIIGEIIANPDGQRSVIPVSAQEAMQVAPLHWADVDGNHIIDDMEILEISDLFDETAEFRSEWERIEEIWDAGGYRWNEAAGHFVSLVKE